MKFESPLISATLVRRYKRFLADMILDNGEQITVHTPNTGSMLGCAEPGTRIWLRDSHNPARKYRFAWEVASTPAGVQVGINTHLANKLVQEAIENRTIKELQGYESIRTEVKFGEENSRIDLLLEHRVRPACYVEVKNVTAIQHNATAIFPDAVSERGRKHLRELMHMARQGYRAVMVYCVQRMDAECFAPADEIDPA